MNLKWVLLIILSMFLQHAKAQDSILSRLEGIWINQYNADEMEIWIKDSTGWSGRSVVIDKGDTIVREILRIYYRSDSLLHEVNQIKDPATVEFHLLASTDDELVFVNMKNDFPKVIHYKMPDKERLQAEVYGSDYAARLNFHYFRKSTWR